MPATKIEEREQTVKELIERTIRELGLPLENALPFLVAVELAGGSLFKRFADHELSIQTIITMDKCDFCPDDDIPFVTTLGRHKGH